MVERGWPHEDGTLHIRLYAFQGVLIMVSSSNDLNINAT
jgi:hypothetical protein